MNTTAVQQSVTINIRAESGQRDLIDQAAERLGRSRSEFMLDAACRQAEDALLDQTCFALEAKDFAAFKHLLDQPPPPSDRLRRTLRARLPWESDPAKAPGAGSAIRPRRK